MTATNQKATWQNMQTKLKSMGGVTAAVIGETKSKSPGGMVCIIPQDGHVDETVLNAPREIHNVTLRRYENALSLPEEQLEFTLDAWRAEILEDVWGDFDLGGAIAYALPASTTWRYGYVTIENTMFRILDISVVYRVDPTATFVK